MVKERIIEAVSKLTITGYMDVNVTLLIATQIFTA